MVQGGGIEIQLEDSMVDYIIGWTANISLKVKAPSDDHSFPSDLEQITWGAPAVHAGMIPRSEVGTVDISLIPVFPFILCHIYKGDDMQPEGCIYTKIVCGTWDDSPDYQGYRDAVALLRRVLRKIWWVNTLSGSYQMDVDKGTQWRVYDTNEVTYPFWMAEGVVAWRQRTPFQASESEGQDLEQDPALAQQPVVPGVGPGIQVFDTEPGEIPNP